MTRILTISPKLTIPGVVLLFSLASTPCLALDINVTITADTNDGFCGGPVNFPCSLRDAVLVANAHPGVDTIFVPAGTYNLTIAGVGEDGGMTGDLDILEEVYFFGSGASTTIVDGLGLDRVFHLHHSITNDWVHFWNMTIQGGDSSSSPGNQHGAGIASHGGGRTWIVRCNIEDNLTDNGHGGGVHHRDGFLRVTESTFRDNHARGGSGITTYLADVFIESSTFVDNYASDFGLTGAGGTIEVIDSDSRIVNSTIVENNSRLAGQSAGVFVKTGGSLLISGCTLADNDHDEVFNLPSAPATTLELQNTVIRGTCNGVGLTSLGGNAEGPGNTCNLGSGIDMPNAAIPLHPLGSYGGPTLTMPPLGVPGNPLIDNFKASYGCFLGDQRFISRPQDGDGNGTTVCDIGAVEYRGLIFGDGFEIGTTLRWSDTLP